MPTSAGATLRIATFNVRYGTAKDGAHVWEQRRHAAFAVLREIRPHLLGLQEALAFQLDELDAVLPEYGRIGVGRGDGRSAGEHAAVYFDRERVTLADHGDFWFSDTPETPGSTSWGNENVRMCTHGLLVDKQTGAGCRFYNLHIDHASAFSRKNSIRLLLERIERHDPRTPVVVTGDFNVDEDDEIVATMLGAGFTDAFRAANPHASPAGTFHDFTGDPARERIDYVFCSPEVRVVASGIVRSRYDGQWPSDHFPVWADLQIPSNP